MTQKADGRFCDLCLGEIKDNEARVTIGGVRHYHVAHYSPEISASDFVLRPGRPIPEFILPPKEIPPQ